MILLCKYCVYNPKTPFILVIRDHLTTIKGHLIVTDYEVIYRICLEEFQGAEIEDYENSEFPSVSPKTKFSSLT